MPPSPKVIAGALDAALAEQEPAQAFRSAIADMLVSSEMLEVRETGNGNPASSTEDRPIDFRH